MRCVLLLCALCIMCRLLSLFRIRPHHVIFGNPRPCIEAFPLQPCVDVWCVARADLSRNRSPSAPPADKATNCVSACGLRMCWGSMSVGLGAAAEAPSSAVCGVSRVFSAAARWQLPHAQKARLAAAAWGSASVEVREPADRWCARRAVLSPPAPTASPLRHA